jgi:hypothetical protein
VTHWTLWLLLLTAVVASGCRETCTSAEIRHGDECVLRPDAGREGTDAESSRVTSSDGPEDAGPGDTAETSSSNDEPSPPNNNSACAPDSATADESCKADPCTPNPCGHGTCSVVADSFSCRCEAGWIGESICDTNTNATLSALVTSEGKLYPAFDPGIHEYTVDVGVDVAEIALIPTATVPDGVVIKVDGEVWNPMAANAPHALALNVSKRVAIEATASSGNSQTYAVILRRTLVLQAEIPNPNPSGRSFGLVTRSSTHRGSTIALKTGLLAAVIEGPEAGDGRVALFTRASSGSWVWSTYIGTPKPGASYGAAITLTDDWLAIGAPGRPASSDGQTPAVAGGVYVFQRNLLPHRAEEIRLDSPDGAVEFGHSVALLNKTLAVLSDRQLHIYELRNNAWIGVSHFDVAGYSVAITDDRIAVSEQERAVRLYRRTGDEWSDEGYLRDSTGNVLGGVLASSQHGFATTSLYACLFACVGQEPSVRFYEPLDSGWSSAAIGPPFGIAVPRALDPNGFGLGLAWSDKLSVVGAPSEGSLRGGVHPQPETLEDFNSDPANLNYGIAYFFVKHSDGWQMDAVVGPVVQTDPTKLQATGFGYATAIDQGTFAVAAPVGSGAIYIFGPNCSASPPSAGVPGC